MSESTGERTADALAEIRQRVKGTNINEISLLATDYLNHFNEIVLVLDIIPDLPECLEEARSWRPKGYQDHFRDSVFSDKDLAIEAYAHSPPEYRAAFEDTVASLNKLVKLGLTRIEDAVATGNGEAIRYASSTASRDLQKLMDVVSAIINGLKPTIDREEIDVLLQA
jgi:hypothetical protein